MKCDITFEDWRKNGYPGSIYATERGIDLSAGQLHSGTTFRVDVELPADIAYEVRLAYRVDRSYPVFQLRPHDFRQEDLQTLSPVAPRPDDAMRELPVDDLRERLPADISLLLDDIENALNDWSRQLAPGCHGETDVAETRKRIADNGGAIAYIAQLLDRLRSCRR